MSIKTDFTLDIRDFQDNLQKVISESKRAGQEVANAFSNATKSGLQQPKIDNSQLNSLVQSYRTAELSTKQFLAQQKELANAMKFAGLQGTKAYDEVEKNIKEADKELLQFNKHVDATGESAKSSGSKLSGSFGKIGELVAGFSLAGLATNAFQGIVNAGQQAYESFKQFDSALANIATLEPAFAGQKLSLKEFETSLNDLSKTIPATAADLANATYQAISAGITGSVDDIAKFTEQAAKVATAGGATTEDAVNGLSSVMNAYKLTTKDTGEVSNTFFAAIKLGKTTFKELNTSLASVIPAASSAGISFAEVAGNIAQITALGVPTAQATTQLRSAIIELQKPTGKLAEVMGNTAVEIDGVKTTLNASNIGAVLKKQGLTKTLQDIEKSSKGMGLSLTQVFSSSEAASAALLLTGENAKRANDTLKSVDFEIKNDVAEKAFQAASKSVDNQLTIVKNNVQAIFNELFGSLAPIASGVLGALVPILNNLVATFKNYWAYLDEAFFKPFGLVWDEIVKQFEEIKKQFKDVFGDITTDGNDARKTFEDIGKAVSILTSVALIPFKFIINQIAFIIKASLSTYKFLNEYFIDLYNSGGLFAKTINEIKKYVVDLTKFWGGLIDGAREFFGLLGKDTKDTKKPFKEVSAEIEKTKDNIDDLNDDLKDGTPPPNTTKTKRAYESLLSFIKGVQTQISDIRFEIQVFNKDTAIKEIEQKIRDLNNSDLSANAKIEAEISLNSQKAKLEIEQETAKLERELQKSITEAEKTLADKRAETVDYETGEGDAKKKIKVAKYNKSELIKLENETINKIDALRELNALKVIDIVEKINKSEIDATKKANENKAKLIQSENDKLNELRIANITDEKKRAYLQEYLDLEQKFSAEYELYKNNGDILNELQEKFLNDYALLNKKYKVETAKSSSVLTTTITDLGALWSEAFKVDDVTTDFDKQKSEIQKSTDDLKGALTSRAKSYEDFAKEITDLDDKMVKSQQDSSKARLNDIFNFTAGLGVQLSKQFTLITTFLENDRNKTKEIETEKDRIKSGYYSDDASRKQSEIKISELTAQAEVDKTNTIITSLGIAKTAFRENTLAYKVLAIAEATIATYVAATKALTAGPILGPILAGFITAAGLANVLKITGIGFKKGGYTGDGSTSDVAGVVHKKEYVVNAKQYAKNKDLISAMENNSLSKYFVNEYGDLVKGIANKHINSNVKSLKIKANYDNKDKIEISKLTYSINKLENRINSMNVNSDRRLNLEVSGHSKISGNDLDLITTKIRNKKAVKF